MKQYEDLERKENYYYVILHLTIEKIKMFVNGTEHVDWSRGYNTGYNYIQMTGVNGTGKSSFDDFSVSDIPEPATLWLIVIGGLIFVARRQYG